VETAVWFAEHSGKLYVFTEGGSFKVKRLRRKLTEAGVELELVAVRGVGFQLVSHHHARPLDTAPLAEWEPEAG